MGKKKKEKFEERDDLIEWSKEPTLEQWATAHVKVWSTRCKRYRAYEVRSSIDQERAVEYGAAWFRPDKETSGEGTWDSTTLDPKMGGANYPKRWRSLEDAMVEVERFHLAKTGESTVASNRQTVVDRAAVEGPKQAKGGSVMKVKAAEVRAMLESMEVPNAAAFSLKRLAKNVDRLAELSKDAKEPTGDSLVLFRRISKALEDGGTVEVVGDEDDSKAESNGHVEKKGGKKGKKKAGGESGGAEKDFLGYAVGSRKAQINALLSAKTAKTVPQIREEGKIPGGYRDYLDELKKKGHVKGDHEKGFVLAKSKK